MPVQIENVVFEQRAVMILLIYLRKIRCPDVLLRPSGLVAPTKMT